VILGGVGISYERGTPVPDTAKHSAECLTGTNRGGRNPVSSRQKQGYLAQKKRF